MNRGSDADGADDQRYQADQAEKHRCAAQATADDWMRFAIVDDQGVRKRLLQLIAHLLDRGRARIQAEKVTLRGPASRQHETGAVEALARHHNARADVQAAQHAIRFEDHLADYAERLAAQPQRVAKLHVQAQQNIVGDRDRVGSQSARQACRRRQSNLTVERIKLRIDGLDRDQHRGASFAGRSHGQGFGDPGPLDTLVAQIAQDLVLIGRRQFEYANRKIARHERACLVGEHLVK